MLWHHYDGHLAIFGGVIQTRIKAFASRFVNTVFMLMLPTMQMLIADNSDVDLVDSDAENGRF